MFKYKVSEYCYGMIFSASYLRHDELRQRTTSFLGKRNQSRTHSISMQEAEELLKNLPF